MAKVFIVSGALIFGVLGTIHLLFTFFTNRFDTVDPSVKESMKSTSPLLTRQTTIWNAWVGFNASHSLGAMIFAGIYIPLTVFHFEVIQHSIWFLYLPVVVGLSYLILAKKYWFKTPFNGVLIATILFVAGVISVNI
ncbi:hypothetical protein [Pseudoalteromonas sp. OOF1S-7]|uniref:LIC_13387 family protein n=1 Tax=Pseudoalteromonas sp. OOF1S-7 TaxID=2917757 RepID=UPI001EF4A31E|nr:hypothetical protein [Pseudoalteromonas sp. OOF1S-7]MCG7537392.1 hypothetical protein [Pseudoalteromonas sp. OOF1S-7]